MKYTFLGILCLDPTLGKVDKYSLSQQTLMELFTEKMESKEKICGSTEESKDISGWRDIVFNKANEVTKICWFGSGLGGKSGFQMATTYD